MNVEKRTDRVVAKPDIDGADGAMERYSNGDNAAFAELYDAIAPRLLGFLRKATRDDRDAEDLMQQTLLQIHRERGSFIPGARVIPWASTIARRLMIDSTRRRRVEQRLFSDAPADDDRMTHELTTAAAAEDLLLASRLEGRIQERLDALPETQRTAYQLLQQKGLSLKEAAEVLGTSVTAVKLRAHRAYAALRAVVRYETRL
jgi:RNA polymerase sigma-70 factor, ECF subfamily